MTGRTPDIRVRNGVYGVLGQDIAYTLSPRIFGEVVAELGWPAVYAVFDRNGSEVRKFLRSAGEAGIVGLNVTKPHKVRVLKLMDSLDRSAQATGAVNTIAFRSGELAGYNTDITGVVAALKFHKSRLLGANALILGTGGAARAVATALDREFRMSRITFAMRDPAKGHLFLDDFGNRAEPRANLQVVPLNTAGIKEHMRSAGLLVNATPLGTSGFTAGNPIPRGVPLYRDMIVFDLVYRPRQTLLLKRASASGCKTVGGMSMLLAQAEESFRIWTGRGFPVSSRRRLAAIS